MDLLLAGLATIARTDVIIALLIGSIGGVIIGAIPGVGPAVAIAILLPATFSLDPIVGLTLLLGIYGSSMYGGAIPAVLINTPGTAVNALTGASLRSPPGVWMPLKMSGAPLPMARRGICRRRSTIPLSSTRSRWR